MLKVALTGGIASGKSEILGFFKKIGIPTLNADAIVSQLYRQEAVRERVQKLLGTADRNELAKIIFSSGEKRKQLEGLIHPLVVQQLEKEMAELQAAGKKIVVVEMPLLFEASMQQLFDKTIAVDTSKKSQLARLGKKGLSEQEAMLRINAHLPTEQKVKKADFVIDNRGSLPQALRQAEKILGELNG